MAIRTLHQSFWYAVVLWRSELRLNRLMAAETQRRFRLFQQTVAKPAGLIGKLRPLEEITLRIAQTFFARVLDFGYQMRSVTLIAGDAMTCVLGVLEKFLLFAGVVAAETTGRVLVWRASEGEYRMFFQSFRDCGIVTVGRLN
jgi:hypothetical protein